MRRAFFISTTLLAFLSFLEPSLCGETTEALIQKLGNSNPAVREAATKLLQDRPESASAIKDALRSKDPEVRRRAAIVLEYFERRPLRELSAFVKNGKIDRAIPMLARLPNGKYEQEAWDEIRKFALALVATHAKKGGAGMKPVLDRCEISETPVLKGKKISEATEAELERSYFVRAESVDIDRRRRQPGSPLNNLIDAGSFVVAHDSVQMYTTKSQVIFAGGSVVLFDGGGEGINNALIVCGGDVTLDCILGNSLVIARGKVTCSRTLVNCRILTGKSLETKNPSRDCMIVENEMNPLGLIRWSGSDPSTK